MMAASYMLQLENGGVGSIVANYLNPTGFGHWGNEAVRVFGTNGFVETTDGATKTRLVVKDKDLGPDHDSAPEKDYFDSFVEFLRDKTPMPLTLDDELHPLRIVLRAKQSALANKK